MRKAEIVILVLYAADSSTTRKRGGTGLGLAISRQLVELMNGEIGVASEESKGSTFYFTAKLHRESKQDTALDSKEEKTEKKKKAPLPKKGSILVAEDNPTNRLIVTKILEKMGMSVTTVENGLQALYALERGRFDLVVMDCQMPVMDGYEATRKLREREAARGATNEKPIPVIALTAYAHAGDREKSMNAGMSDYLIKPLDPEKFQDTVRSWLSAHPPKPRGGGKNFQRIGIWKNAVRLRRFSPPHHGFARAGQKRDRSIYRRHATSDKPDSRSAAPSKQGSGARRRAPHQGSLR